MALEPSDGGKAAKPNGKEPLAGNSKHGADGEGFENEADADMSDPPFLTNGEQLSAREDWRRLAYTQQAVCSQ